MARASTPTKLPLTRWAQIFGVNPLHFEGVEWTPLYPQGSCSMKWFQYAWQDTDRTSREDLARAIASAEADIEAFLGFHLLPTWTEEEWRPTARPSNRSSVNGWSDVRGYRQAIEANWKHWISGGIRSKSLISAGETIAYTEGALPTSGYKETATVSLAVPNVADPAEVRLYYPGTGGDDAWEIRPIRVALAGGVATITFRREQAVLAAILETTMPRQLAVGDQDADFLDTVDVYRVYNDPQVQATMMWEPIAAGLCGCTTGCANCAYAVQQACLVAKGDPRLSWLTWAPGVWNAETLSFDSQPFVLDRNPDVLRLFYYSGYRDRSLANPTIDMDADLAYWTAILAATKLDRPICSCSARFFERWTEDLAYQRGNKETTSYWVSDEDKECPWGTKRGAIEAWKRIRQRPELRGGAVGAVAVQ